MVFQLVYSSAAVRPLAHEALVDLLEQSRTRNDDARVTGMLLYRDSRFLQLLEGDERVVRDLYARIAGDARHREVRTVGERRRLLRQFPTWTMAFRDLAEEPFREPGCTALFEDAAENVPWAVDELLVRLRPSGPEGRPVVHGSRALGLFGG
ncbi:hypothetical protein GCM10022197_09130 [Microlunatus spumicola]|uniref:BLUF domain-containing protein n=1 Tax=Microlunatus spumicola TaxID=81499 RepID=A0ABP6WSQ4_9ACTN